MSGPSNNQMQADGAGASDVAPQLICGVIRTHERRPVRRASILAARRCWLPTGLGPTVVAGRRAQVLLQDCSCGEPLLDHFRKCPRCGKPNQNYRQPRWRTFWPEIDSAAGADEAIALGYWAAFLAAGLGAVMSVIPGFGVGIAGLIDAALYGLCGVGIWRKWRTAAVVAFLLFAANLIFSLWRHGGIGVLAVFIFVGLLNGLRGTFRRTKLSEGTQPEAAG